MNETPFLSQGFGIYNNLEVYECRCWILSMECAVEWLGGGIGCCVNEVGRSDYFVALLFSTAWRNSEEISQWLFRTPLKSDTAVLTTTLPITVPLVCWEVWLMIWMKLKIIVLSPFHLYLCSQMGITIYNINLYSSSC